MITSPKNKNVRFAVPLVSEGDKLFSVSILVVVLFVLNQNFKSIVCFQINLYGFLGTLFKFSSINLQNNDNLK